MSVDGTPAALKARVVLVTGGSGFLGSSLVERLLDYDVAEVRVLTRKASLASRPKPMTAKRQPRLVTGDLSDQRALLDAVGGAQVVFHLAAMKSVELCENSPAQAINTNVLGTGALLEAALAEPRLERFIAISSDKASRPTSVYGLTKALMEEKVAAADARNDADFGTVRCGSLWGSTGSVLARWEEAARTGSDLSVTDPEMTRFVMLRLEAVELILQAVARRMDGSILCRVMPAYVLGDLAALWSEMHGLKQRMTGRRPGEKLHEDLISDEEAPFTERHGEFLRITRDRRGSHAEPFNSGTARHLTQTELRALLSISAVSPA
jgi:UDP-N-acetylglucosamine 4,6-dehydratase/5-epimerase